MIRNRLAYKDVEEILDRALTAPHGLKLDFPDEKSAIKFCNRAFHFRTVDRIDNATNYGPEHELHGRSNYDALWIRQVPPRRKGFLGGKTVLINLRETKVPITELTEEELDQLTASMTENK